MAKIKKKQQKSQITSPTMTQKRKRKKLSQAQIALILRHRRKQRLQKYWDYFLLFVAIAFCIFFLTNYKAHQIVGNSMLPTLASGDRILIKKHKILNALISLPFVRMKRIQKKLILNGSSQCQVINL